MMNKVVCSLLLAASFALPTKVLAGDLSADPYAKIEHIKYANGLEVFLAPSETATTVNIEIAVATGTEAETKANRGVSHLLEHVLFRDKGIKDEMTYLQLITEAGGSANGGTGDRETTYYGNIPSPKSTWLFDKMTTMLLKPSISDEHVSKEKGTVELERGKPGPITVMLHFNPMDYLRPNYLKEPDFWETEFDIKDKDPYTISDEQLSTRRLTTNQVKTHYENYYYPANMRIFVAGHYNRDEVVEVIKSRWASLPNRTGKKLDPPPRPAPRASPFLETKVYEGNSYVYVGTKGWNLVSTDFYVADAYLEYLAHRLMKEIRNAKGQTYTASGTSVFSRGFGYGYLKFQTPTEHLDENLALAQNYIQKQAEEGGLSASEVKEALDLHLARYTLSDKDAPYMMETAKNYANTIRDYGSFSSPYAYMVNMTPEKFNGDLKKIFKADRRYLVLYKPALFFQYDYYVLCGAIAIGAFLLLRRLLTKPFAHDKVRWIRKMRYPSLRILDVVLLVGAFYIYMHAAYFIELPFHTTNALRGSLFFNQYVQTWIDGLLLIFAAQGVFCLFPRKLMVVGDQLVVKSITYYSRHIPLEEIASVEAVSPLRVLASRRLLKVKHRFHYFHALFWKKGLLVNLRNGTSYYYGVSAANDAKAELAGLLTPQEVEKFAKAVEAPAAA